MPNPLVKEHCNIQCFAIDKKMHDALNHYGHSFTTFGLVASTMQIIVYPEIDFNKPITYFALNGVSGAATIIRILKRHSTTDQLDQFIAEEYKRLGSSDMISQYALIKLQDLLSVSTALMQRNSDDWRFNARGLPNSLFKLVSQFPGMSLPPSVNHNDEKVNRFASRRHVVCAANVHPNGAMLVGSRHSSTAMSNIIRFIGADKFNIGREEEGFIDKWDQFISREEAMKIVLHSGQPINLVRNVSLTELYSEGLY